ncbi:MAG: nascent polypeptide-associated complex protein [Candidatus Aenigmarchaeota archaeon]|nr:nascent polypeptide-associated complex protein [Candidatus Aenigmarchaeota archaeon]
MKINPRQMERMMKQMGMQMSHIDAEEVIIKTSDKEIVISNPEVSKVNVMGKETFQITGEISERSREEISDEDVEMVAEQAGVSSEEAKAMLEETKDIAEAIVKLKKE